MFTVFVMFGIVHDLRVDRLQAEGHDQGVDDSVLGQEVARLVPVPRVRHNLGSISPTFSVQFLCMQISKVYTKVLYKTLYKNVGEIDPYIIYCYKEIYS